MRWDFWRSRTVAKERTVADDAAPESGARSRPDPTAELKARARRRLIGAAALLLAVIVIVPAVLDPTPKPLPGAIPIEIPSEKTPFTPRLSLPPLPEPAAGTPPPADAAAPSDTPAKDTKSETDSVAAKRTAGGNGSKAAKSPDPKAPEKRAESKSVPAKSAEHKAPDAKAADAKRARDLLEGRADAAAEKTAEAKGRFVVQAAASSSEVAALELADRISATGLKSYVEKLDAKDGVRFRVRVGPYGSRDEAERARARLRAIGVNANLVAL